MNNNIVLTNLPNCPKCESDHTTDEHPSMLDIDNAPPDYPFEVEKGKARYYCLDCSHKWKKYRGRKPYSTIKRIEAYAGGYPGPSFDVKIDLEKYQTERIHYSYGDTIEQQNFLLMSDEEKDWLLSELYKCDFLNWSEEYFMMAMDGSHWTVKIEYETYCEIKTGSNHFPEKWSKFCKTMAKISGGEFY
jgi:hypothetical protein